ncbi:MAG UNVERIFIED_CONTAM: sulfite exporter TauE/SafE family protein [Microcystis novacekii LVE1205-3]|jgi:uncharacterized membrane protein YfcA
MTLLVIGSVSLLGTIPHWKKGNINLKTAFIFGSATMVGAFLGARLATLPFVTATFQMLLIIVPLQRKSRLKSLRHQRCSTLYGLNLVLILPHG